MWKRQTRISRCYRKWRRTFYDLEIVYGCNNGISNIHGKEFPQQSSLHCEYLQISHLSKCFDISAKLVTEQEEISGLETIGWENHSWKYMSLTGDERNHQSSTHEGLRLFQILSCVLGRSIRIRNLTMHGRKG